MDPPFEVEAGRKEVEWGETDWGGREGGREEGTKEGKKEGRKEGEKRN